LRSLQSATPIRTLRAA